jgi:hypothetical protein
MTGGIPSGKRLQFAIEHGPVVIVDLPTKHGGSFYSYVNVYQRLTNMNEQSRGVYLIPSGYLT